MTDRSAHELDRALASALDDLARAVEFPPTPDLALAVADAVGAPRRTSWSSSGAFSRGLVAGMAAVLLLVGAVGAVGIGIGALQIRLAGESPLPTPVSPFPTRAFGREVTAEQADAAIAWPIVFPDDPVLGKPEGPILLDCKVNADIAAPFMGEFAEFEARHQSS